jgi:hypothetical protein
MKGIILAALITCFAVGTAAALSCDSKAAGANGKPLHGAAKMSFVRDCKRDACAVKAVSAEGKPLYGAAKKELHGEVREGCLDSVAWLFRYRTSLTGGSLLGASAPSRFVSLKANWLFGLNGIRQDPLDGRTSCAILLSASNRNIKISASIATTYGSNRPKERCRMVDPHSPKL